MPRFAAALLAVLALPARAQDADFQALLDAAGDLSPEALQASLPDPGFREGLSFAPSDARFYDEVAAGLKLNEGDRALLEAEGFVIAEHGRHYSMGSAYYAIYAKDLPVLITTDSVLHAMHRSFDAILEDAETWVLSPVMGAVLDDAAEALAKRAKRATASEATALRDVDLYLTVAKNLLEGAAEGSWKGELRAQPAVADPAEVLALLGAIKAGAMQTPDEGGMTRLFGAPRLVDYTQFRPRGHYSHSVALQRYFRMMMWLGRADTGFEIADPRQLAGAATLAELLRDSGADQDLAELDALLAALVGESDNLGPTALLAAMDAAGVDAAAMADADEEAVYRVFDGIDGRQRIRSQVVVGPVTGTERVPPPEILQLFGQRFAIDSLVLSEVVFDSIVYRDQKVRRMMPSSLDVAAALGNDEAVRLLEAELAQYPYAASLQAAREYVAQQQPEVWTSPVYNRWLDALRTLDDRPEGHLPEVMQTALWQRKQLQTQLASWAELRHDTILYAKQSYTVYPSCEYPTGYVEPYPALYAAVAGVAASMADALDAARFRGVSKPEDLKRVLARQVSFLRGMAGTVGRLEQLAEKELAAKRFTADEAAFIKQTIDIRGGGSGPPRYDGWYPQLFFGGGADAAKWSPEVADVHTDPASGQVLQVGTGDADFMVVAIDNDGDRSVYVGPVYSYYELEHPAADRLTDEAWERRLGGDAAPARPDWVTPVVGPEEKRSLR